MVTILVCKMSLEKPKSFVLRAIVQNNCCVILLISRNKIHLGAVIIYEFRNRERRIEQKQKTKSNDLLNCYTIGTDFQLGTDKNVYEGLRRIM